ncbi:MAG: nuclear transport factor 2 family protein [Anaerolineales bacterium]|jgi:hypothetical protein
MPLTSDSESVRAVLQQFQDGYRSRELSSLDDFMNLFARGEDIELIGISAFERGGVEWFEGAEAIREIIQSDWTYWGSVELDVNGAKVTSLEQVAWLTTTGTVEQTDTFDQALPLYLQQMQEILVDDERGPDEKLIEASHFGVRRLRERLKGSGYRWPFVFSAVLIQTDSGWKFHTIHWSMPVD